MKGKRKS